MNNTQRAKRNFRKTKRWNDFRKTMKELSNSTDIITQKPLYKGWNLHHRHISANDEQYTNIDDTNDFIALNVQTHDFLHWLYRYYVNDKDILKRIEEELNKWY